MPLPSGDNNQTKLNRTSVELIIAFKRAVARFAVAFINCRLNAIISAKDCLSRGS